MLSPHNLQHLTVVDGAEVQVTDTAAALIITGIMEINSHNSFKLIFFSFYNMFQDDKRYQASKAAVVTMTLPFSIYMNAVRVFPYCA